MENKTLTGARCPFLVGRRDGENGIPQQNSDAEYVAGYRTGVEDRENDAATEKLKGENPWASCEFADCLGD